MIGWPGQGRVVMTENIGAIIPAAGKGRRMGRLKPLLDLGEGTVIAHVAGTFREAGVDDITVVLGHRCQAVIPELRKIGVAWQVNEHYEKGMISSVKWGIEGLGSGSSAFFILPEDFSSAHFPICLIYPQLPVR